MNQKLKTCPFCGSAPKVEQERDTGPGIWLQPKPWPAQRRTCQIRCCDVHVYESAEVCGDEERARKFAYELAESRWNRRAPSRDAQQAAWFKRASEFGPWVEVEPGTSEAVQFVAVAAREPGDSKALVPLIPNAAMREVMDTEGWQWEDLLAAAEAITEEQYSDITAASAQQEQDRRDAVRDAIATALGEAYDCLRVWSAWGHGTMGPDDFALVAEDADRLNEITDAAITAMQGAAMPAKQDGGKA